MTLKICVLGSGSEGNSALVYSETTAVLIDAGFSCRKIVEKLEGVGFDPANLDALLITHEHGDHMRGAGLLSKKYSLPVYLTEGTLSGSRGALHKDVPKETLHPDETFTIGDIEIDPFTVPHDAGEPVA
ncbi:MAG: MBL fold metallo-hydrolase, partial [Nitrospinota bacterium]